MILYVRSIFNDDIDYLNFNDDTFGNKKNDLVLFPKIKLNNEKLIQSGNRNYKLTIQFGSVFKIGNILMVHLRLTSI